MLKKIIRFTIKNYLILLFFAIILFVGLISLKKIFYSKSIYVYAKIKVGQGLWWATTAKPSIWFVNSIKKGETQYDLIGNPLATILDVRYYPYWQIIQLANNQFDIYLTVKLKVGGNKKTKTYIFNRATIGVGAPIDLEFPSTQITGTVIDLQNELPKNDYTEKTILLIKKEPAPWEYDSIKINDSYYDGTDTVFKILDKQVDEMNKNIIVRASIKVRQVNSQLIFGEEQLIKTGSKLNITTSNFTFDGFYIGKIN